MADYNNRPLRDDERIVERERVVVDNSEREQKSSSPLAAITTIIVILLVLAFLAFLFGAFRDSDNTDIDVQTPAPSIDITPEDNTNNNSQTVPQNGTDGGADTTQDDPANDTPQDDTQQ